MKAFPLDEIGAMRSNELVAKLESGEMSLLKTFRVNKKRFLKRFIERPSWSQIAVFLSWISGVFAMKYIVGPVCRLVLWYVLLGGRGPKDAEYWRKKRAKTVRAIRRFFPDNVSGTVPGTARGLIVGFNHPTLHEILSLIAWSLERYPDRRNNYPTNLPWYESICTVAPDIRKLGVWITPLITQSTFSKLEKVHKGDEKTIDVLAQARDILLNHYFKAAVEFELTGDNTFSAPSAGRQVTIYPGEAAFQQDPGAAKLLPAMSGLMFRIARANRERKPDAIFLPVTVIPPKYRIRRLKGRKLCRRYNMIVGRGIPMEEARVLGRGIDYAFLQRLSENAPEEMWYPRAAGLLAESRGCY